MINGMLAYENPLIMRPLVDALMRVCPADCKVIWRGAFRWKTFTDGSEHVIPNAYEMFGLEQVANERNWTVLCDFNHAAIVRPQGPSNTVDPAVGNIVSTDDATGHG